MLGTLDLIQGSLWVPSNISYSTSLYLIIVLYKLCFLTSTKAILSTQLFFSLQVQALKNAHESNPCGRWWVKADACDVRKGLRESVKGKWAGDEDLNDGELENCRAEYQNRKEFATLLGLKARSDVLLEDLRILYTILNNDLEFLWEGELDARTKYEKHRSKQSPSESLLMGLAWDLVGFQYLLKEVSELKKACLELETAHDVNEDLQEFRTSLLLYTKQLFMKKRVAATHLMVFMIADESRNRKPYALPVQVMPFKGMKDSKLRELYEELRKVMVCLGMTVVGNDTTCI